MSEEKMEQWEIDRRAKLEKELPNRSYFIGTKDFPCFTGKQGYIEFDIAMVKEARKFITLDFKEDE